MKKFILRQLLPLNLCLFDTVPNVTSSNTPGNDLSPEMKTYYSDYLIDNATPNLVHDQFGQKHPIPKNGGKTIEFRKYSPLAKALTPLDEGVTPDGQALNVSIVTATVEQYGGWIQLPDMLLLTAIDNNMVQATELLGDQAGRTLDTITREELNGGDSVIYAPIVSGSTVTEVSARHLLTANAKMSVDVVKRAVRFLKTQLAKPIDGGYYVGIIHPDVAYDLMSDDDWIDSHKYAAPENLFTGEIGRIAGCRFVESTEAKIFTAKPLISDSVKTLTVASYDANSKTVTIDEELDAAGAAALKGRKVIIDGEVSEITNAAAYAATGGGSGGTDPIPSTIVLKDARTEAPVDNDIIYPGEAGAAGRDVYSTLIFGANAYGVTEVTGGGLEVIVKQLGSAGTADPLNQRASAGWKATKTAKRLVESFMVRVETGSTYASGAN